MGEFRSSYHQNYIPRDGRKVVFLGDHATTRIDNMYVARSPSHDTPTSLKTLKASKLSNYSSSSPTVVSSVKTWFRNPEMKRKKRVAKYKIYAMEGKVKNSFKKGYRWLKKKCHRIVHGY
ncbi:hypothetical protein Droror1_Dr00023114 [Drosera rotundifolia]